MDKTATDPLLGAVLEERYRVRGIIARGGMATVYHAWDERLERTVAVKVMHPAYAADPSFVDRFVAEARSIARLSHPNVVAVFDQGSHQALAYLVMEYVPGPTLRHVLAEHQRLSPEEAVGVLGPMLAALATAHRIGMVHRDVKPENVLLGTDGSVKVADFGLARIAEGSMPTTTRGVLFGTVAYVAPEIVTVGSSDARADVYAAGIVLFEMLTGKAPFRGESPVAVAYQHVHSDVPPPSQHAPGIPYALDDLVARATRRDPGARPADAGAMLAELRDVESDLAMTTELPSVPAPPPLTVQQTEVVPRQASHSGHSGALAGTGTGPVSGAPVSGQPISGAPTSGGGSANHQTGTPAGFSNGSASVPQPADATAIGAPVFRDDAYDSGAYDSGGYDSGDVGYDQLQGMFDGGPSTAGVRSSPAVGPPAGPRRTPPGRPIPPPRRRRAVILLAIFAVLIVATASFGWWLGAGRYATTPAVLGMTQQQATAQLRAAGFEPKVGTPVFDEKMAAGKVAKQDPVGSGRAVRGSEVTISLSKGPERYVVPDLAGQQREAAEAKLRSLHLTSTTTEKYADESKPGEVLSSDPKPGTKLKRDGTVKLVISKGPPPVDIPDVTKQGSARASKALRDLGFEVRLTYKFDEKVNAGAVLSQDPMPPGPKPKGSTITLTVSKGPEMVTVPDVTRKPRAEAEAALRKARLNPVVAYQSPGGPGVVVTQNPLPNSKVRPNTAVQLIVF